MAVFWRVVEPRSRQARLSWRLRLHLSSVDVAPSDASRKSPRNRTPRPTPGRTGSSRGRTGRRPGRPPWCPTGFGGVGYGGIIGTLGSTSVPGRTIGWSCSSEGLHLELDLPALDARLQSADDALADILSALPWRGFIWWAMKCGSLGCWCGGGECGGVCGYG